jgi:cytochrome c551/c552
VHGFGALSGKQPGNAIFATGFGSRARRSAFRAARKGWPRRAIQEQPSSSRRGPWMRNPRTAGIEMNLQRAIVAAVIGLGIGGAACARTGEDLIAANKCSKCHTATSTKKGPSFASLAAKYQGDNTAPDKIVVLLKTGGADDHGKVAASDADLKAIATVVLSSK